MKYLLDTNVIIRYLNQRSTNIIEKLRSIEKEQIVVCSVVKAELFYGAKKSNNPELTLKKQKEFLDSFKSLSFDDRCSEIYASIRATLSKRGLIIGPNDLMIASIAIANRAILITHNSAEFNRISELQIEDWE